MSLVSLITPADFDDFPYKIATGDMTGTPDVKLTQEITERQEEFLIRVLGHQEYYNLQQDASGAYPTTPKWIDFVAGTVYVKDGDNIDYKGILTPLTQYVYYYYQRDNHIQAGTFGGQKMALQNAKNKAQGDLMTKAWNKMRRLIGNTSNKIPTVYNYLNDHDFDAEMQIFKPINNIF